MFSVEENKTQNKIQKKIVKKEESYFRKNKKN